jgi:hypothetical protein
VTGPAEPSGERAAPAQPDRPAQPEWARVEFARAWAAVLDGTSFVALARSDIEQLTLQLADVLAAAVVDDVTRAQADTGLPPRRLQLEVTESAVMAADADGPLTALHKLANLGVRIAVDDFGTGYSNLAYLRRLPVHELKLAGAFLDGLRGPDPPNRADLHLVASLIDRPRPRSHRHRRGRPGLALRPPDQPRPGQESAAAAGRGHRPGGAVTSASRSTDGTPESWSARSVGSTLRAGSVQGVMRLKKALAGSVPWVAENRARNWPDWVARPS